jgi:uncharacterized membrane protein YsdA (DUF1294 family)
MTLGSCWRRTASDLMKSSKTKVKWSAENKRRRIPEVNLLFVALIGGSAGAIAGQQVLRHKTWKEFDCRHVVAIVALSIPTVRRGIFQALGIR